MDLVLRPAADRFLEELTFPAFELGAVSAHGALDLLARAVRDDWTRVRLELLLDRSLDGAALEHLEPDGWLELVYRLLFREWVPVRGGWNLGPELPGYAGRWEETLHLALMLEHPRYPYWDEPRASAAREAFLAAPPSGLGLAGLIAGRWEPCPRFAPHQVLQLPGRERGLYLPDQGYAIADWSYRLPSTVSHWNRLLPNKLGRLLKREQTRLRPLELPEADEILAHWLGKQPDPPALSVAFSGLGPRATHWVKDLGALVRQVQNAAELDRGITVAVAQPTEQEQSLFGP